MDSMIQRSAHVSFSILYLSCIRATYSICSANRTRCMMCCLQNPFVNVCVRASIFSVGDAVVAMYCMVLFVAYDLLTQSIGTQHCYQFVWFHHDFFQRLPASSISIHSTQYYDSSQVVLWWAHCGRFDIQLIIMLIENFTSIEVQVRARTWKINEVLCVSQLPHLFPINNKSLLMMRCVTMCCRWLFHCSGHKSLPLFHLNEYKIFGAHRFVQKSE